jgi:uncharacterized lipoprotein YddW (UPF0748 family)
MAPSKEGAEFRAFWVDEFHAGIRTPQEAAQLVEDARRANVNTLIVQVRGRADALYTHSLEPPREDPAYDPTFDALQNILEVAHRAGLEVHAWVNAMTVWRDPQPPRDPRHVFNLHGPGQSGEVDWLTHSPTGDSRFAVGYFLDAGHPGAAAYLAGIYRNIAEHYAVDGVHFDYIRYPETSEHLPRGAGVGYNATSLERFRRLTGRSDTPAPDDPQWIAWRRQQVTQLARRVYLETKAVSTKIKVSAAVIAWGAPPHSEKDFQNVAPMQQIFQDWNGWLKEGILDLAIPMNYAREADPVVRGWFDGWLRWEKRHKHGRQLVIGLGAYLNTPASTLAQIERARTPEGKERADGVSFFSYANLGVVATSQGAKVGGLPPIQLAQNDSSEREAFLTQGEPPEPAAFSGPAPIPQMEWIEQPVKGWVLGVAKGGNGKGLDGLKVALKQPGWFHRARRSLTDGNGFFGFTELKPGRYLISLEITQKARMQQQIEVVAGQVTRVELVQP